MCSLQEHIERGRRARETAPRIATLPPNLQPRIEYTTGGVLVWQKVGDDWINSTPGHIEPEPADVEGKTEED